MNKKRAIAVMIAAASLGTILGYALLQDGKKKVVAFRQEMISRGDIEAVVTASGTINPVALVEVGSQVSGNIARILVDYNSQVKEGQVLAELDSLPFQIRVHQNQANYSSELASLEKAKVTLENLKAKYERALSLAEKNLISSEEKEAAEADFLGARTDLRRAEAGVQQAKSQLDSSRLDLSFAIIRSPIDGLVISRNMEVGQTVQASFTAPKLFEIANDLGKMQVECQVDEADVGRVKEGQKVRFTVDAFPEDVFYGAVKQVRYSPTVNQNVVTYTTIVDFENPERKLRPGMTAAVSIITGDAKGALRIPNSALRFTPELPAEEIAGIIKAAGERLLSKRQGERGLKIPAVNEAWQSGRQPSKAWFLDDRRMLNIVLLWPGITDNAYTEILVSDLNEGQKVITGLETAQAGSSSEQPGGGPGPPNPAMFMAPPPLPPPGKG